MESATLVRADPSVNTVHKISRRRHVLAWLSVLIGTAAIGLHGLLYGNWIIDDAAITFAYAREIAGGHGPVLQPGADAVEGYSNQSWLLLLVLGKLLGLFDHGTIFGIPDYVLFPKALALLCCAGILAAIHAAAAKVSQRPWLVTAISGVVLALIPSFVIWSFSGLENSLYGLSLAWLTAVMFRAVIDDRLLSAQVAVWVGLLAALAALTRPDGLIYLGAYPLVVLVKLRRTSLRMSIRAVLVAGAAFLVPFGGYLVYRILQFGRLLPNTAIAKSQDVPEVDFLTRMGELTGYAGALPFLMTALCVGIALATPSRLRGALVVALVPMALALTAYCVLEPDWMGNLRFATPVWVLMTMTAALAVPAAIRAVGTRGGLVLGVGLIVSSIPTVSSWHGTAVAFRANPPAPLCTVAESYGHAFNGLADTLGLSEGSLLLPDLGGSAMTSRLALIDLAGLTDARMADYWNASDMRGLRDYVFGEVQPTFIHFHTPWGEMTGMSADERLPRDYYPVHEVAGPSPQGDWVRKDVAMRPEQLAALRAFQEETKARGQQIIASAPRRSCGPVLRPGQVPG